MEDSKVKPAATDPAGPEETKENIIKGINKAALSIKVKIIQLAVLLAYVVSLPVITPMFGASKADVAHLMKFSILVVIAAVPIALYRIYEYNTEKKELQKQLAEIEKNG